MRHSATQTDPCDHMSSCNEPPDDHEYALCEWQQQPPPTSQIHYLELCLNRAYKDQRIGLTLCYSSSTSAAADTDIFVSEIKPASLADRDGRIRTGDQVLKINGVDVRTRAQAVELFRERRDDVRMLIARRVAVRPTLELEEEEEEDEEEAVVDETQEKDSGISRTTTDSDRELMPLASPSKLSELSSTDGGRGTRPNSCDDYEPAAKTDVDVRHRLDRELEHLHREMELIQRECDRLIGQHCRTETAAAKHLCDASVLVSSLNELHLNGAGGVQDLQRCVVNNNNNGAVRPPQRGGSLAAPDGKRDSACFTMTSGDRRPARRAKAAVCKKVNWSAVAPMVVNDDGGGGCEEHIYASISGDTVYTTLENLQTTILQQQNDLRRAMGSQQQQPLPTVPQTQRPPPPSQVALLNVPPDGDDSVKMEWKVKRRSDGSRYITRRPVRRDILRHRAERLADERHGCSTDDDANSELKIGRYWSKEQRRLHRDKCKERKRRQEDLLRRKADQQRPATEQQVLQLSYKKMLRRQGQQLLDRFTTIQEFLAHGNRTADNYRALGLVSVTTV